MKSDADDVMRIVERLARAWRDRDADATVIGSIVGELHRAICKSYLLRPSEAGELIGVSESTIYRMIAAGELRVVDVAAPGSARAKSRVRRDDLEKLIEKRTRERRR